MKTALESRMWGLALAMSVAVASAGQPSERAQPMLPDGAGATGSGERAREGPPEAVVLLRDGRRVTGFLLSQDLEVVVVRVGGVPTRLPTSLIDRVEVLPPVLDRYQGMRQAADETDPDQLVQLAEWLRARGYFDEAIAELNRALALRPGHPDATRLLVLARGQRELAARAGAGDAQPGAAPPPRPAPRAEFPVLTADQINTIRVYEVDLKDPPDLLVPRATMEKVLARFAGDPSVPPTAEARDAILRLPPARQLELMFRLQARDLYPEVQVLDHPRALLRFRDDVHRTWLMNSCATSRCHGGEAAGRLRLNNRRPNADATVYTNFLILDRFRLPDGTPLIDYKEPGRSALLHMALPRRDSLFPHPVVPARDGRGDNWRPPIRSADDRRFVQAVEWMRAMYQPRPEYPVQYQPPGPAPEPVPPATSK